MNLITRNEFLQKNTLFTASHLDILIRKARAAGYPPQCGIAKHQGKIMVDQAQLFLWINNRLIL